jgi:putative redox protein
MTRTRSAQETTGETILIEETGLGPFQLKVTTGSSTFMLDEPIGAGGLGSGPNPYDLLSAALGASTATTIRAYATAKRWPLERIHVRVSHQRPGVRGRATFVRQILLVGRLDEPQRVKLLAMADRCPIQLSIGAGPEIKTTLLNELSSRNDLAVTHGDHMRDVLQICQSEN